MGTKQDVTESISDELINRFPDKENINCIEFITRALGNFFNTDQLEEFYKFIQEE